MNEIQKVLSSREKVLWEGKPKFWPYFLSGAFSTFFFGLIWMSFLMPFGMFSFLSKMGEGDAFLTAFFFSWNLVLLPFLAIGVWMILGAPIYKLLLFRYLYYSITDKRVILQKGVIGRDFEYIDFDQITNSEVRVGLWDKLLGGGSGSILVSSAGSFTLTKNGHQVAKPYVLCSVENPYDVFKFFKQVSHDVKTDIEYPNKLRPKENPGYQTEYGNLDKKIKR